jgi:hypothetical protein
MYISWPPVETTLSVLMLSFLVKNNFYNEIIKSKAIAINAEGAI